MPLRRRSGPVRAAWIAPILLLLSGCIYLDRRDPYPADWSPIRDDGFYWSRCPDLSGTYNYQGRSTGESPSATIPWTLTGYGGLNSATHFSIKGPIENRIEISIWKGDQQVYDTALTSPRDFTCFQNKLEVRSRPGHRPDTFYGRARDGALVQETSYMDGLFVGFIYLESRGSWTRWSVRN